MGCCALDNAVIESFFGSLERELTGRRRFRTRAEARTEIFEWIEVFYNRQRLHSTNGNRPPVEYEAHAREPRPIGEVIDKLVHSLKPKELISS
jgi:transposase InsO family protein